MAAQRLNRMKVEFSNLLSSPPPGISCRTDHNQAEVLIATISGPEKSPFEGGSFDVEVSLGERYPFAPPNAKFLTPIYHPNIDIEGRICLSGLKPRPSGSWNCSMNIATILSAIRILLAEPNLSDPLMANIAEEYRTNYNQYWEKAKESARKCAAKVSCEPNASIDKIETNTAPEKINNESDSDCLDDSIVSDKCLSPIIKSQIPSVGKGSSSQRQTTVCTKPSEHEKLKSQPKQETKSSSTKDIVSVTKNVSSTFVHALSGEKTSISSNKKTDVQMDVPKTGVSSQSQVSTVTFDDFAFDSNDDDDDFCSPIKAPVKKLKFS